MLIGSLQTNDVMNMSQEFTVDPLVYRRHHQLENTQQPSQFVTLLEVLGKGSMAKVSLVLDVKSRLVGALKVYKREKATHAQRELTAYRKVNPQPFVLHCLAAFKDKSTPIILTEYAPFGTLDQLTSKKNGLGSHTSKVYALEIARAVDFLHQRSILHRDVKPANVLVLLSGHVALGDMNSAHDMSPVDAPRPFQVCGTQVTRPPEVWSCQPYGFPVDVWQMGITYYNVASNRWPYFHANAGTQAAAVKSGVPIPFSGESFSNQMADLIRQMLQVEPSQRISSSQVPKHDYFSDVPEPYQAPISPVTLMKLMDFSQIESQVVKELMKVKDIPS